MKVKLVMTLPSMADAKKFMNDVITQVQGRYHFSYYFNELTAPSITCRINCGLLKGNSRFSFYELDAADLEPAIISVIADFAHFGFLTYDFRIDGKSIGVDWWKPTDDELLDVGCSCGFEDTDLSGKVYYDDAGARYAADIYRDKLNRLSMKLSYDNLPAKKTA